MLVFYEYIGLLMENSLPEGRYESLVLIEHMHIIS